MQGGEAPSRRSEKRWAVKLGDFTALGLPTEGGVFHRKVARGSELWTRSPESAAAGATNAVDALHLLGSDPIEPDQNLISLRHALCANAFRVGREGKAVPTFPGHARTPYLTLGERHCHKPRRSAALYAHQHAVLVVGARGRNGVTHIVDAGNALAADFEDDVAFLEAAFGRSTLRIDFGHHDAILAGAGHSVGRSNGHAELRHVGALGCLALVLVEIGLGLNRVRQLAERQIDDLVLALVQHVELDSSARRT